MKKYIFILLILLNACTKNENTIVSIKENTQNQEMITAYREAYDALDEGDPYFAAKKFLEAELLLPQSDWAPRAALLAAYSYYIQNYYADAILTLERFTATYPNSKNLSYAHYLLAMCYYELIEDEKRDSAPLLKAQKQFIFIINNYPKSEFALDAKFKLNLIENLLAAKEVYLGRHYIKKEKWIAAINRFKSVINNYDETIYTEEAIHRLVEINYKLGLLEESKKYATLLGYNYLSSEWYKKSYKIFNKNYEEDKKNIIQKDKGAIKNIFKKLF